jgi:hypothetical protein
VRRGARSWGRRLLLVGLATGALVVVPAGVASAKGAQVVTITGPGLSPALRLDNLHDEPGLPGPNDLANATGAFLVTSSEATSAITGHRPDGSLGPRYRITFQIMTGPDEYQPLRQDVYPFARAGFVVHTPSGQRVFDRKVKAGWYTSAKQSEYTGMESDAATALLVAAGVPKHARAA